MSSDLIDLHHAIASQQSHVVQRAAGKLITAGRHVDIALAASVASLLNDEKWDEVIVAANVRPALQFHKAYALYKKERFAEALAIVAAAPENAGDEWRHLHGQILFRLGRHADAAVVYEALVAGLERAGSDPLDLADARANLAATLVASDQAGAAVRHASLAPVIAAVQSGEVGSGDDSSPELYFNVACALAEAGDPALALRALGLGLAAGEEALAAGGTDAAGIAEALAPLKAQAAYVLQLCRFDDAAVAVLRGIGRPGEAVLAATVAANAALLRRSPRDVLGAYKALKALLLASPAVLGRMTPLQTAALRLNLTLLARRCGRPNEEAAPPAPPASAGGSLAQLLQSASVVLVLPQGAAEALPGLAAAAAASNGAASPLAALCRAQLLVDGGQLKEAAECVAAATSCTTPAAASAVAVLRAAAGNTQGALDALDSCITALRAAAAAAAPAAVGQAAGGDAALVTALLLRAGLRTSAAHFPEARADYDAVVALPFVQPEQRAAALASAALTALQAAQAGPAATRPAGLAAARALVSEASACIAATGEGGGKAPVDVDALEWPATAEPDVHRRTASAPAAAAAGTAAGVAGATTAVPDAAKKAKKRKALARRARRRAAYVARLKAAKGLLPLFAAAGGSGGGIVAELPPPDPERWLPRRLRTYGKKSRRRALGKAAMNVSSGGAQGAAGGDAAVTAALDAKAKADAAAAAAAAAPPPAVAASPSSGKKGKGRR